MLPTEDLFVYVYAIVDDTIKAGAIAIPGRPGPAAGCSNGEILAITQVRLLLGRRGEAGFLAEVALGLGTPVSMPAAPERVQPEGRWPRSTHITRLRTRS